MAEYHKIRRSEALKQAFIVLVFALGVANVVLTVITLAGH